MIVVADSGPLIALASIEQFDLLRLLFSKISIPKAVREEVIATQEKLPGAEEVANATWIQVLDIRDTTAVQILRDRLDIGESQAIVLSIELRADLLVIDEARGRRVADAHGLNKTGTLGILVMAKRLGLIRSVVPLLDDLLIKGFRMSVELYNTIKKISGEI
jgi:uncharacterized protein